MRFNVLPLLFIANTVLALPVDNAAQDITIIQRSMKNVSNAMTKLRAAIHNINPRMSSNEVSRLWPNVESTCHMVADIMDQDALQIRKAPMINLIESTELLGPINELETSTQQIVNEWISIKPAINRKDRENVLRILKDHKAAAGQYADALLSRQSGFAAPAGQYFGSRVQQNIQQAINAYSA
jgi:hypothetical protein